MPVKTNGIVTSSVNTFKPSDIANLGLELYGDKGLKVNGAASFDGAARCLTVNDTASIRTGNSEWWMAGWFYPSILQQKVLWQKHVGTSNTDGYIYLLSTNKVSFTYGQSSPSQTNTINTTASYNIAAWNFYIVRNSPSTNKVYVSLNGGAWEESTYTGVVNESTGQFRLGGDNVTVHFNGYIDAWAFGRVNSGLDAIANTLRDRLYNAGINLTYQDLTAQEKSDWGLVSWWDLDEMSGTRNDAHGTNHLTDNNAVTYARGVCQRAATFNGTNQYLSIATNSTIESGDVDWVWAFWFYRNGSGSSRAIIEKLPSGPSSSFRDYDIWYDASGTVSGVIYNSSGSTVALVNSSTVGNSTLNGWDYFVVVHDSVNNQLRISVNGSAFVNSASYTGTPAAGTHELRFGSFANGASYIQGNLHNVCFFKPALGWVGSNADALKNRLYNGGLGIRYSNLSTQEKSDYGLVSWWALDELSGTRNDSHGTNHLTDNNSVGHTPGVVCNVKDATFTNEGVTQWRDYSSLGIHVTQHNPAWRAFHVPNVINGLGSLSFGVSGTSGYAGYRCNKQLSGAATVFVVLTPGAQYSYYVFNPSSSYGIGAVSQGLAFIWNSGAYTYSGTVPSYTAFRVSCYRINSSGATFKDNNFQGGIAPGRNLTDSSFWISGRPAMDAYVLRGYISAYLVYDRYLTDAECNQVCSFLAAKYVLPSVSIPAPDDYLTANDNDYLVDDSDNFILWR